MSDMHIDASGFQCCICMSGDNEEHDESLMWKQKEMEKSYDCKTRGDFGFLSKVCKGGHMLCLACHEHMWDKTGNTGVAGTCPMCRRELLEPNSFENHDLISVYPAVELLAGSCDTADPQTIEANCVSWATVVASKVMNSPRCLIYYTDEALHPDLLMPGWIDEEECWWRLRFACYQWIPNIHKLLHAKHTLVCKSFTTEQYREYLRQNDPTHVFIFYDSIEQYCEKEIIAPLIDMNAQLRSTIRAYANKNTRYSDVHWLQSVKGLFGHYSACKPRFGIPYCKNTFKRRYVSCWSDQNDRNDVLTQVDVDLRMHRLKVAIIPLPDLRNTKDVLECICALQTSILEEDQQLPNFNAGTSLYFVDIGDVSFESVDGTKQMQHNFLQHAAVWYILYNARHEEAVSFDLLKHDITVAGV